MDLLLYLIDRAGRVVTADELIESLWPTASVSEANIRVQIAGLGRALSASAPDTIASPLDRDTYIRNVGGRGYQFTRAVSPRLRGDTATAGVANPPVRARSRLPPSKTLVGRDEDLARLCAHLATRRLVTLVGPAGIGKTALALAAVEAMTDTYADGVVFIDLSPLCHPGLVVSVMTMALDIKTPPTRQEAHLIKHLARLNILLVLDHCAPVTAGVAALASLLLEHAPGVRLLTTSREALGVDGEDVFEVGPIENEAAALFTARAGDAGVNLGPTVVAEICDCLGGNPLAIELAAGIGGPGPGGDLVRTLDAVLAASHAALEEDERRLMRALSIFRSGFSLASALAVVGERPVSAPALETALAALAIKGLLTIDHRHIPARYDLPGPVRAFVYAQLTASDDFAAVAGRHVERLLAMIRTSVAGEVDPGLAGMVHDIRAAIGWAFSKAGNPLAGMQLTSSAIEIGRSLPILAQYAQDLDRAIDHFDRAPGLEAKLALRLVIERISVNMHLERDMDDWGPLTARATAIAQDLYRTTRNPADLFEIQLALFSKAFGEANGPRMTQTADELRRLAAECGHTDALRITIDRTQTQALHFNADHTATLETVERILACSDETIRQRYFLPGDRLDQRITIRIFQARSLWLTGRGTAATAAGLAALDKASGNLEYVSCYILAFAVIPVHFWRGDLTAAGSAIAELLRLATEAGLSYWENWGVCYQQALVLHGYGDPGRVPAGFTPGLAIRTDHMATVHDALVTDATLERAWAGLIDWCAPEVLRAYADRALAAGTIVPAEAEATLQRSLKMARAQGALAWELRTATSLARLWGYQRKPEAGIDLLRGVFERFQEGFGDADLIAAQALLADLATR